VPLALKLEDRLLAVLSSDERRRFDALVTKLSLRARQFGSE
jgi:hypothetical protein